MTINSITSYLATIPLRGFPSALEIIIAVLLDWLIGGVPFLNPARLLSRVIDWLQNAFYKRAQKNIALDRASEEKHYGLWTLIITIAVIMLIAWLIPFGFSFLGELAASIARIVLLFFAFGARSLCSRSLGVAKALKNDDKEKARKEISKLVARDCEKLSAQGISRAACEAVAVNASNVVVAPMFYAMIGFNIFRGAGVVLAWGYVAAVMLGFSLSAENRYYNFGYYTKRFNDLLGLLPSRLTALGIAASAFITGKNGKRSFSLMLSEGSNASDLNRGWPMAAVSGAIGIKLGGGAYYSGIWVEAPTIGFDTTPPTYNDIRAAVLLMALCELLVLILGTVSTYVLILCATIISFYDVYTKMKRFGGFGGYR